MEGKSQGLDLSFGIQSVMDGWLDKATRMCFNEDFFKK